MAVSQLINQHIPERRTEACMDAEAAIYASPGLCADRGYAEL